MQPGQTIYFKTDSDVKLKKGELVEQDGENWKVRGCRTSDTFTRPVFFLPIHQIIVNHVPERQRTKKTERGHGGGLCIPVAESIRRQAIGMARLGLTEGEVLQARVMVEIRRRTLCYLAATNGIAPFNEDFDYQELASEYLVASLSSLRTQTAKAPDTDIQDFRRHLAGETDTSRIMMTVARTSKTVAIRYLKSRTQYHRRHVDLAGCERRMTA